ncbi:MAG: hypothetical protein ACK4PR_03480 [Gammaproteobacteria bacterium]
MTKQTVLLSDDALRLLDNQNYYRIPNSRHCIYRVDTDYYYVDHAKTPLFNRSGNAIWLANKFDINSFEIDEMQKFELKILSYNENKSIFPLRADAETEINYLVKCGKTPSRLISTFIYRNGNLNDPASKVPFHFFVIPYQNSCSLLIEHGPKKFENSILTNCTFAERITLIQQALAQLQIYLKIVNETDRNILSRDIMLTDYILCINEKNDSLQYSFFLRNYNIITNSAKTIPNKSIYYPEFRKIINLSKLLLSNNKTSMIEKLTANFIDLMESSNVSLEQSILFFSLVHNYNVMTTRAATLYNSSKEQCNTVLAKIILLANQLWDTTWNEFPFEDDDLFCASLVTTYEKEKNITADRLVDIQNAIPHANNTCSIL